MRTLRQIKLITENTKDFGDAFEHFIFLELKAFVDYLHQDIKLNFWRSTSGFEVNFILDGRVAIETIATKKLSSADLKGLKALREENLMSDYFLVCRESAKRMVDGIMVYPWQEFLDDLWAGRFR